MSVTKKGDFLLVEQADRLELDSMYRTIVMAGYTLDTEGLISMAKGMLELRHENPSRAECLVEAIEVIEGGGWIILEFKN